jgi:hypothetical protein
VRDAEPTNHLLPVADGSVPAAAVVYEEAASVRRCPRPEGQRVKPSQALGVCRGGEHVTTGAGSAHEGSPEAVGGLGGHQRVEEGEGVVAAPAPTRERQGREPGRAHQPGHTVKLGVGVTPAVVVVDVQAEVGDADARADVALGRAPCRCAVGPRALLRVATCQGFASQVRCERLPPGP